MDELHGRHVKSGSTDLLPTPAVSFMQDLLRLGRNSGIGLTLLLLLGGCYVDRRQLSSQQEMPNQQEMKWKPDFSYTYARVQIDLSSKAIFGTAGDLLNWQKLPQQRLRQQAVEIQRDLRVRFSSRSTRRNDLATVINDTYIVESAKLPSPLTYTISRWTPREHAKHALAGPVIVAFDGHGGDCVGDCTGKAPERMFQGDGFGRQLVQRGWTVIGVPTAIHKPLSKLNVKHDFPLIWAALATLVLKQADPPSPHDVVYLGNSAGGLTAVAASIIDPRTLATVTNGAFFPLDFTRHHYRVKDHPLCHDMREFASYVPFYALLYPLPLMIQVGKEDGLWMGNGPVKSSDWFSGLPRGATSDETVGATLLLQRLWTRTGKDFSLAVRPGGHEPLDATRVDQFLKPLLSGQPTRHTLSR